MRLGAVAAGNADASRAALGILAAGGNAIDAAVAAAFVMGTVEPLDSGLGAGGFMIVHDAASGRTAAADFLGTAPAAARYELYAVSGPGMDYAIKVKGRDNERGHRSVAVPGAARGLGGVQAEFGRLPLAAILAPAIRLAEEGFAVSRKGALRMARTEALLNLTAETRRVLLKPDGTLRREGERMANPDYAASLRLIAEEGPDSLYTGTLARTILADMEANGGFLAAGDLAAYEAVRREPIKTVYRGLQVATMPPPSSGGLVFAGLNALEAGENAKGDRYSLLARAMLAMFRERAASYGDPAFVSLGRGESTETTSLAVVDRAGNAACITYSNNNHSGVVVPGTGILLNNQMQLFSPWPANPNEVVPGKRPVSSMMPSLLFDGSGMIRMAIGASGSTRIPTAIMQVLYGYLALGMGLADAVAAPRLHAEVESLLADEEIAAQTQPVADSLGLEFKVNPSRDPAMGSVQAISVEDGRATAVGDPRSRGSGMVG